MKLYYDKETDSLYIELSSRPSTDSQEIADGVIVDFDSQGSIVGIDLQHAAEKLDLDSLETESLPTTRLRIG
jgi:uncharacterized protein YuzE